MTAKIFVDGDLLAFPAAARAEDVIYVAKDGRGRVITEFSSAKEYDRWVMACEFVGGEDIEYGFSGHISEVTREKVVRPKDIKIAKRSFENTLDEWLSPLPLGDVVVYLAPKSGQPNFRHEVALRKPYKGNRKGGHKPLHLPALREWAFTLPYTKRATKFESDDLVAGMAYRHGENGYAVQNEKDIFTLTNCWIYYPDKHTAPVWSDPNIIGRLEWRGKNIIGMGRLFNLAQGGIFGDSADNYSGLDGAGPSKAWEVLSPYNDAPIAELPNAVRDVCRLYIDKYGPSYQYINKDGEEAVASWYDFYVEGVRLSYMLKSRKDYPHEFITPAKELFEQGV